MDLFIGNWLREYLETKKLNVEKEVYSLTLNELENSNEALTAIFLTRHTIHPISLSDPVRTDGGEIDIDISNDPHYMAFFDSGENRPIFKKARVIKIHMSYKGDQNLFLYTPNTHTTVFPRDWDVMKNELIFKVPFFSDQENSSELVKKEIKRELDIFKEYVEWTNSDIQAFNSRLQNLINTLLSKRREKLTKDQQIFANSDIPAKEESKTVNIGFIAPKYRIDLKILEKPISDTEKEYILDMSIFNEIIKHIDELGINLERTSQRLRDRDEESLRDIFFIALNSAYKGTVSTEAFNHTGKTDLLIRQGKYNVFIAEFKIWHDNKYFLNGINQLLSNLTWNDTRCSYVIFSRNANFTDLIEKCKELIKTHSNYKSLIKPISPTSFLYEFSQIGDNKKQVRLSLHLINIAN
ncbi:MAG: hypothetical protein PHS34_08130 [Candidatus Omnitrophica bacterium]|nr:hypothetical protein [Candidatus Nanoarchaeia archaeon]MDD5551211.1 hypothetical protein [Candidatus Omnitrophota bacterium]